MTAFFSWPDLGLTSAHLLHTQRTTNRLGLTAGFNAIALKLWDEAKQQRTISTLTYPDLLAGTAGADIPESGFPRKSCRW